MKKIQDITETLIEVKEIAENLLKRLELEDISVQEFHSVIHEVPNLIDVASSIVRADIYEKYQEFFECFKVFSSNCTDYRFLVENIDNMVSSLALFAECLENIEEEYAKRSKLCVCCGSRVIYNPLPSYYSEMKKRAGDYQESYPETLNRQEYLCPICNASDRDRLIVSFLKELQVDKAIAGERLLQIAPARTIEHWIHGNCTSLTYQSTDLFMETVSFKSDIQNMSMIEDGIYDYFICSHVLEHVEDDRKAMRELYRILSEDGIGIFLVPIDLNVTSTDEEWGLSEEENWRRFGQGDHCRKYARQDVIIRLKEAGFYVHELNKNFFGEEVFFQCGLTDTSVLYVLTKCADAIEKIIEAKKQKRIGIKTNQPLVSVILPSYNHEEYVAEAIESILNQTYPNIELLIADDGSTDKTQEIILQYKDKIDQIYLFDTNRGGGLGKFLAQHANGKYIAMMHSDDIWFPEKIEKQVEYMESHLECGACFTGAAYLNHEGQVLEGTLFKKINMSREQWIRYFYQYGNCLAHPSILARTEIYVELPQKTSASRFRQLPDYWMWLNLLCEKEIHVIEKDLMYFRMHEGGTNKNTSARIPENRMRHLVEESYIWYRLFTNMENNLFKRAFHSCLIDKEVSSEEEILCEKMFVLLSPKIHYLKQAGIFFMYDICGNPNIIALLEEKYGWTKADMARISGEFLA